MMNRREFLAMATMSVASTALSSATSDPFKECTSTEPQKTMTNKPPKLLVFDVNETLLDLSAMKERVAKALGGRGDLLPLWFTTMLQYSLVSTVGDNYEDFGAIGAAAMMMVARNHGIDLSERAARDAMVPMRSLPPHPEVAAALDRLKQAGFRMVTLTNSSHATVDAQIGNAGLLELFEDRLSIEDIQMFKPHTHAYRWAAKKTGVAPEECLFGGGSRMGYRGGVMGRLARRLSFPPGCPTLPAGSSSRNRRAGSTTRRRPTDRNAIMTMNLRKDDA